MKKLFTLLSLLPAVLFAQTFSASNLTPIPNTQTDLFIPVVVQGLPSAIDNAFGVATVCIDISHQNMIDLKIRLRSPSGTEIVLSDMRGGSGYGYNGTCFEEDGTAGWITSSAGPFNGTFIPQYSLNTFNNGQNPNGTWNLVVTDMFNFLDSGFFHSVTIDFRTNPPVDPPTSQFVCTTSNASACQCPDGTQDCDLLPDMTASLNNGTYNETPGYLNVPTATPNVGWGPLEIHGLNECYCGTDPVPCSTTICPSGDPPKQMVSQTIYHKSGGVMTTWTRPAGTMAYHPSHGHIHVDDWIWIDLRRRTGDPNPTHWPKTGIGSKQSYCLINLGTCDGSPGTCQDSNGNTILGSSLPNNTMGSISGCSTSQGIYVGSYDTYGSILVNIPNTACNGDYYAVSITDPLNVFLEQNDTNNWLVTPVTLTHQLGAGSFEQEDYLYQQSGLQVSCLANAFTADSIVWYWGDGTHSTYSGSPATPAADHTYASPGDYTIEEYAYNHCGLTFSRSIPPTFTTNINTLTKALVSWNVYPIPAKDKISIDYTLANSSNVKIEINDAVGHLIKTMTNENQFSGKYHVSLNLNSDEMKQGIYFVRITANDKVVNERFIVLK